MAEEAPSERPEESEKIEASAPKPDRASSRSRARRAGGAPLVARMRAADAWPLVLRACALRAVCGVPIDQISAAWGDICRACSLALTGAGLHHACREHLARFFAYFVEVGYEAYCEEVTETAPSEFIESRRDQCLHELARALQAGRLYEDDSAF